LEDKDGSYPVLNEQSDRFEIRIAPGEVESDGEDLSTGEQIELEITSRSGGSTQIILTMPQQLAGQGEDNPVPL
jgi:flagellin FlaB